MWNFLYKKLFGKLKFRENNLSDYCNTLPKGMSGFFYPYVLTDLDEISIGVLPLVVLRSYVFRENRYVVVVISVCVCVCVFVCFSTVTSRTVLRL